MEILSGLRRARGRGRSTRRWNVHMPKIVEQSISILFDVGLGMAMFSLVFAQENAQHKTKEVTHHEVKGDEPKHTDTDGGENGGSSYSAGFSPLGGVYGGGQICKWGCYSESFGCSQTGGSYNGCTCCTTLAQAEAHKVDISLIRLSKMM